MSKTSTDHDEIRAWAEGKGGKPAAVEKTHSDDDVGLIRLMFPDDPNSEHANLVEIGWDEFFEEFDKKRLALVYDDKTLFSKLVSREADR